MLPLTGITVVALEQAVAAPLATRHLADWGARVIKVERPGSGDFARDYDRTVNGLASHFVWLNRGKESLTLDLKQPEAREVLAQIVAKADVFLQNLGPGAVERLGFGAQDLRAKHPALITCGISGYGTTGSYRERKAYDLLIQAESGIISTTGTEDHPSKIGVSIADIASGMYAYTGVLTALIGRGRTSEGANIEVSMLEALGEWMGFPAYYSAYSGVPLQRSGAHHASIVPYGPIEAGDGTTMFIAVQNQREWARFCEHVLGDASLAEDARFDSGAARQTNRDALYAMIEATTTQLTGAKLSARLEAGDIAFAEMRSIQGFVDHPQLKERDRFRTVDSPAGPLWAMLPPATFEGMEAHMGAIPAVGAHTDAILTELGYDAAQIARLQQAGAV
ncbi:MAG: CaiB/BaiF CoA-transferase family protein [Chloroflexi bacterium]|nr:CaiB/BaiF CoA-transferase family protein [Chloroflexota bacterium]